MAQRWRGWVMVGLVVTVLAAGVAAAWAQSAVGTIRIALLPQWVVNQHRGGGGSGAPLLPAFRSALDGGVVDRVVFWWQRGVIQRQALVGKPMRVLSGSEAAELGGRGEYQITTVRPPRGPAAWTEVDVVAAPGRLPAPGDVLVLEIGGELNTVTQVLETLLLSGPGGELQEVSLARAALVPGRGVPVLMASFGRPVMVPPGRFHETGGVALLVARSQVQAIVNGDVSVNGFADTAPLGGGDWREGDRVLVRVPLATLRAGAPSLALGWKDRTLQPDPDGTCSSPRC